MTGKLLLLLGLGAGALVLSSGTAHAESVAPHPDGFDVNNPPKDVLDLIQKAVASANPALMRSTADHLDELGYHPQATALRTAAGAIEAAQAAVPLPPLTVPPASSPGQPAPPFPVPGPVIVPGPPGTPAIVLPPLPIIVPGIQPATTPSGANPLAAQLTAQLNLTDPIANGRTPENSQQGLVTQFQAQEKKLGKYSGALDGLYGAGTAMGVASYGIVPYPPFFWSRNKQTTAKNKAAFRTAMLAKAASDPTRADEWQHVAQVAQNT